MLDYSTLRNVFKGTDKINSKHLVLAEWNMNKYQTIEKYGLYTNLAPHTNTYDVDDGNMSSGENYLIYDDGTKKLDPQQEYFSQLSSIFKTNRPDPGIILLQKYGGNLIAKNASSLRKGNVKPYLPRYYPFSEFRKYDYFNSAKTLVTKTGFTMNGVSWPDGTIVGASPFIVYEDTFPCNKITIKVQNHIAVPAEFSIEILQGTTWVTAYTKNQSSSADFATGVLDIYYNPSTGGWVKVAPNTNIGTYVVNDLSQLDDANPTELKLIKGIRLSVHKMSTVTASDKVFRSSLELIEFSPRLEVDLSDYTESFSFNSSLGDASNIGLPVGSVVASSGEISLSNEDGIFLFSGKLSELRMLSPEVKFLFYQLVNDSGTDKAVPLKVMFSNEWNIGQDYSVSVSLEDGFKFLRETSAPDLLLQSNLGQPLSIIILFLLDNVGITGFEFKKTTNSADSEDTIIRSFFCKKEQTVAEVLEELALATQCSMYFDPVGNLNILTKERLTEKVGKVASTNSTLGTDFWMIFDEDYTYNGGNATEQSYISTYKANVISYNEKQLNPITDGDIVYHTYGPPKSARLDEFPEAALNRLLENSTFPASLAFANFGYNSQIVWNAAQGDDGAMGAANLIENISSLRLKDIFTGTYTAFNEDDAVRSIYSSATITQRKSMILYLDANEGLTINPYQGTILLGNEFIKYNGKLFSISSTPNINNSLQIPVNTEKIFFSKEEFTQEIRNIGTGGSIKLIGLVVDITFQTTGQTDDKYTYKVIGDGRAKFGSEAQTHYAFVEEQSGINESLKYGLALGSRYNPDFPKPTTTVKNNFLERTRYKSAYRALQKKNLLDKFSSQSYLGFLKLIGRVNQNDRSAIDQLYADNPNADIGLELERINQQTDESVPGDFDDFVFLEGEKNIYGQKFQLGFKPNIISTRMRLFSPRRRLKNSSKTAETLSSIAGIAFGVNRFGEGYYLEVEGVGSGKSSVASEAYKNNLRFYKVKLNNGVFEPNLIFAAPVAAYATENIDIQLMKADKTIDPYFDLTIIIEYPRQGNLARYTIRYGDVTIGRFTESVEEAIDGNTISLFVRGDSQAIYEYISAGARPIDAGDVSLFRTYNRIDESIKSGILPLSQQFFYRNDNIIYYFNDFAKLVREVKDYDIRFTYPAYTSAIIDISKINGSYMVKKYQPTPFGAKLIVANTSPGPILLTQESNNPLYIVAVAIEELSSGVVTMEDSYDKIDELKRKIVNREENKAIYGTQTFSVDSQFMQSLAQARGLMRWIIRYCNRPRIQINMEIFANPLLELGDKVKVYDKSRGYNEDNARFGNKTFVISSINYSTTESGPTMNVDLVEVGAA